MSSRWPFFTLEYQVVSWRKGPLVRCTVVSGRQEITRLLLVSINCGHLAKIANDRRYPSVVNQKAWVDGVRHLHKQRQSSRRGNAASGKHCEQGQFVTPDSALLLTIAFLPVHWKSILSTEVVKHPWLSFRQDMHSILREASSTPVSSW